MDDETSTGVLARLARGVLLVTGVTVFTVGLLVVFVPGMEAALPVDATIATLGSDYVVVATVGLVAIGVALFVVLLRRISGVDEVKTPVVEGVQSASYPGESFDRSNDGLLGTSTTGSTVERLREAAVQSLMRAERCSRSVAEGRVAKGTWTDDRVAAEFLADDGGYDGVLGGSLDGGSRARRTVEAIEAVEAGDGADGSDGTSEKRRRDHAERDGRRTDGRDEVPTREVGDVGRPERGRGSPASGGK